MRMFDNNLMKFGRHFILWGAGWHGGERAHLPPVCPGFDFNPLPGGLKC